MKTETEKYWIIKTKSGDTYVHYFKTGQMTDAWGVARTAERFDTKEETDNFIREELEHPDEYEVVCVNDIVCVGGEYATPPTERDKAMSRWQIEMDLLEQYAKKILDAINNDLADAAHKDEYERSNVIQNRVCPASNCFTRNFNLLLEGLQDAIDAADDAWKKVEIEIDKTIKED